VKADEAGGAGYQDFLGHAVFLYFYLLRQL
jgi:hypothetical protein